jgi:hypothetical protein
MILKIEHQDLGPVKEGFFGKEVISLSGEGTSNSKGSLR